MTTKTATYDQVMDAAWRLQERFRPDGIFICVNTIGGVVSCDVNWSSLGAKSPEEARRYMEVVGEAIEAAENFAFIGYKVVAAISNEDEGNDEEREGNDDGSLRQDLSETPMATEENLSPMDTDLSDLVSDWKWIYDVDALLDRISEIDPTTGVRYERDGDITGDDLEAYEWDCDVRHVEDIAETLHLYENLDVDEYLDDDAAFAALTKEQGGKRVWRGELVDDVVLDILEECVRVKRYEHRSIGAICGA